MKNEIVKANIDLLSKDNDKLDKKLKLEEMVNDSLKNQNGKHNKKLIMLLKSMIHED